MPTLRPGVTASVPRLDTGWLARPSQAGVPPAILRALLGARDVPLTAQPARPSGGSIGFSAKINDPAFARYMRDTRRWSVIFASVLAAVAVAGFYIYGEISREMDNPEAVYIGLGIGGMFIGIAILQELGRKEGRTWDGVVTDKKIEQKQRQSGYDSHKREPYTLIRW